jgi:hypothetical protein
MSSIIADDIVPLIRACFAWYNRNLAEFTNGTI